MTTLARAHHWHHQSLQTTGEREPSVPSVPGTLLGYWKSLLEVSTSKFEFCNFIGFSINVIPVSPQPLGSSRGRPLLNLLGLPNSSEKVKPARISKQARTKTNLVSPVVFWPVYG